MCGVKERGLMDLLLSRHVSLKEQRGAAARASSRRSRWFPPKPGQRELFPGGGRRAHPARSGDIPARACRLR